MKAATLLKALKMSRLLPLANELTSPQWEEAKRIIAEMDLTTAQKELRWINDRLQVEIELIKEESSVADYTYFWRLESLENKLQERIDRLQVPLRADVCLQPVPDRIGEKDTRVVQVHCSREVLQDAYYLVRVPADMEDDDIEEAVHTSSEVIYHDQDDEWAWNCDISEPTEIDPDEYILDLMS